MLLVEQVTADNLRCAEGRTCCILQSAREVQSVDLPGRCSEVLRRARAVI